MDAAEALKALQSLLEEIPPYPSACYVSLLLEQLAIGIASEKVTRFPEFSSEVYATVIFFWDLFCHTDEEGVLNREDSAVEIRESAFRLLYSITAVSGRVVELGAFKMVIEALNLEAPVSVQILGLKIMRNICTKNENIREMLVNSYSIFSPMILLIQRDAPCDGYIREWCVAITSLVSCDDPEVSYNRSWERKQIFRNEGGVKYLCQFLNDYKDEATLNSIVILLGTMASVKGKYSEEMVENGVLSGIVKIFTTANSSGLLVKHTLALLRSLCMSSPDIRGKVSGLKLMKILLRRVIHPYKDRPDVLEIALACLAYMTLQSHRHVRQLLQNKGVENIFEIIQDNMDEIPILKAACFTLRNIVVNGSEVGKQEILSNNADAIIHEIGQMHPDLRKLFVIPLIEALGLKAQLRVPKSSANLVDLYTPAIVGGIKDGASLYSLAAEHSEIS